MPEQNLSAFNSSIAEVIHGDFEQFQYGKVILPLDVLRRVICVIEPTNPAFLKGVAGSGGAGVSWKPILGRAATLSPFDRPLPVEARTRSDELQQIRENPRVQVRRSSMSAHNFEPVRGALD